MDSVQYQRHGKEMVDYIANYLDTIRERRVFPDVSPGYMKDLIPSEAPEKGENWENIISDVERVIMPGMTHWQSPHMHAYFPATHSFPSLLGDMLSDGINALGFTWASSPACTELEIIAMDWLGKMIGLPSEFLHCNQRTLSGGGGVLQTTASEATFVSLLAARTEAIKKLKKDPKMEGCNDAVIASKLVCYCSEQAHSSVEKASLISLVKLKLLPTDDQHRLRADKLKEAIASDRKEGLTPFYLCATLGTTGCCSFDSLEELGPICEQEGMWMHVDAAYAGSAFVCPEYRHLLKGVEFAQSFVFNPSKWLLVNFDCTAMWVKNSGSLHSTFNVDPLYLQHENSGDAIDYMHWQVPLSRRFRALKLWFVMRSYGVEGLQAHIRKNVGLGQFFEALVRKDDRFEIPAKRHLGLIVLRLKGENVLTERLLKSLNRGGQVHMVPASLKGIYVIRFTVTSTQTTEEDLIRDWKIMQDGAKKVLEDERTSIETVPVANKMMRKKAHIKRRYTWSHYNRKWDMSLLLSNVPVHPNVVNGTFAALYDSQNREIACSANDVSCDSMINKETTDKQLVNGHKERKKMLAKRVLSLDTGVQMMAVGSYSADASGSKPTFAPAITEMSSSSSSEELSPIASRAEREICGEDLRVPPLHLEDSKVHNKTWLSDPAHQLLDKLTNMKILRRFRLSHGVAVESDVIPEPPCAQSKQERNGHYGVDG